MNMIRLTRKFYTRDTQTVAKDLLGKIIVRQYDGIELRVKIVETEAYLGFEDKGCHTYNGRKTKRTEAMYNSGGYTYVYLIYGIHQLFNVVTEDKEIPEAVLIRAVEPLNNFEVLYKNRNKKRGSSLLELTNGPGKWTQALQINQGLNQVDLTTAHEIFIINQKSLDEDLIVAKKRINIDYAEEYKDKKWRYFIKDNAFVSKK